MVEHLLLQVHQLHVSNFKFLSIYNKVKVMNDFNVCGIYKITNLKNNKFYIGSSHNIKTRIHKHFELLKRNKHHSTYFQNAYNKYGRKLFIYEILEVCDVNELLIIEQKYLDNIVNWEGAYNVSRVASGSNYDLLTHPNQKEIRLRMSKANKGKHTKPFYINETRYEKLQDAANEFNVDIKAISSKLKNWKNKNWYYEDSPKIGEYDVNKYGEIYFYKPITKKKYYCQCGCGKEVSQYAKYHKDCRKANQKQIYNNNPVVINDVEYKTPKDASRKLNIGYVTILHRINSQTIRYKDYYYKNKPKNIDELITIDEINKKISKKNKGNNYAKNNKPFTINNIKYNSLTEASNKLNIRKQCIWNRLRNNNFINYKYLDY
jgi:group I intron endonuclease